LEKKEMPSLLNSKTSTTVRDHRVAVASQIIHEHFGEITRVNVFSNSSVLMLFSVLIVVGRFPSFDAYRNMYIATIDP
jgi:hypothetical protein